MLEEIELSSTQWRDIEKEAIKQIFPELTFKNQDQIIGWKPTNSGQQKKNQKYCEDKKMLQKMQNSEISQQYFNQELELKTFEQEYEQKQEMVMMYEQQPQNFQIQISQDLSQTGQRSTQQIIFLKQIVSPGITSANSLKYQSNENRMRTYTKQESRFSTYASSWRQSQQPLDQFTKKPETGIRFVKDKLLTQYNQNKKQIGRRYDLIIRQLKKMHRIELQSHDLNCRSCVNKSKSKSK